MDPFEPEQGGDAIEQGIEFERLGQEIVMRVIFAMAALEIMDVGGDHQDHRIVAMLLPDGPRGIPAVTAGHGDVEHNQVGRSEERRVGKGWVRTCRSWWSAVN